MLLRVTLVVGLVPVLIYHNWVIVGFITMLGFMVMLRLRKMLGFLMPLKLLGMLLCPRMPGFLIMLRFMAGLKFRALPGFMEIPRSPVKQESLVIRKYMAELIFLE